MIRAKKILREGQALLETELITLVRQGKIMNTEDRVFGYVVNVDDDTMLEVEVKSLAIVNDKLYAFMARVDDRDYSEEEALKMLKERSARPPGPPDSPQCLGGIWQKCRQRPPGRQCRL